MQKTNANGEECRTRDAGTGAAGSVDVTGDGGDANTKGTGSAG
jgi:hypothetical protein